MNPKRYPFLLAFLLACALAHAQVPQTLSYQGLLTDATGNPLNGTQSVKFNFYKVATGGTLEFSRGALEVAAFQGLFTVILGNGQGENNAGLPNLGSTQYYIGIRVGASTTDLSPRVQLTAVPYAFTASNLDPNATVSATQLTGTVPADRIAPSSIDDSKLVGISASKVTGNLPATQVTGLGSLAGKSTVTVAEITDGAVTNAKITGPISLANGGTAATNAADARTNLGVAIGTNVQAYNANLDDLADGSLTGSKIGAGIDATKITTNSVAIANGGTGATTAAAARTNLGVAIGTNVQAYNANLDDLADGSLTGSKIGAGVDGANITTGIISIDRIAANSIDNTKLASEIAFKAKRSSGVLVAPNTVTPIGNWSLEYNGLHSTSAFNIGTGEFTAPLSGWYAFSGKLSWNQNMDNIATYIYWTVNGGRTQFWNQSPTGVINSSWSSIFICYLSANDKVGIVVQQNSTQYFGFSSDEATNYLQGFRIGN